MLQVEMRDPKTLVPYFQNAKPHKVKLKVLAQSIKRFGFDQPIVVDEKDVILKGHGRRLASISLNLKEVPVVVKTGLTEAQKRVIRIADNKIFEKASINDEAVKSELDALMSEGVEGMADFFDLSNYDLVESEEKAAPKSKAGTGSAIAGKLLQCPKCGAVQWEGGE